MLTPHPKRNRIHMHQKGRWKHHPQGVRIPTRAIRRASRRDQARKDNFWKKWYNLTKCYIEGGVWASVNKWVTLVDYDYNAFFEMNYNNYDHYFDAVRGTLGSNTELDCFKIDAINQHCTQYFTALETNLFAPKGFHMESGSKPIVFYSGFTIAISPFKEDFIENVKSV